MSAPTIKTCKVYAVVESVVEVREADKLAPYLRAKKFKGNTTINYNQGGVTNIVTREIIPLTMKQLDSLFNGDN